MTRIQCRRQLSDCGKRHLQCAQAIVGDVADTDAKEEVSFHGSADFERIDDVARTLVGTVRCRHVDLYSIGPHIDLRAAGVINIGQKLDSAVVNAVWGRIAFNLRRVNRELHRIAMKRPCDFWRDTPDRQSSSALLP